MSGTPRFVPGKKAGTWLHLNAEAGPARDFETQKADPQDNDDGVLYVLRHYAKYGTLCEHFDGHGVVEAVYRAIHKQAATLGPGVRLPHTVIYRGSTMASWYFTSVQDGLVKKKSRRHRVPEKVLEAMLKAAQRNRQSDIVASYAHHPPSAGDDEPAKMTVEYFDAKALEAFLFHRTTDKHSGVLQAFVEPPGPRNATIRAKWTPHLLQLETRVNLAPLADSRLGRQARGPTFDGPENASELRVFRGDAARNAITAICDSVARAVVATRPNAIVTKMTLDVKVDAADRLWVLSGGALHIGYMEKRVQSGMYIACAQCDRLVERPKFKPGASLPRTLTMHVPGRKSAAPPPAQPEKKPEEEEEESASDEEEGEGEGGEARPPAPPLPPVRRPQSSSSPPTSAHGSRPARPPAGPAGQAGGGPSPRTKKQRTGGEAGAGDWPAGPVVTAASALVSPRLRLRPFVPAGRRPAPLVHEGRRDGAGFGTVSGARTARSYARYDAEESEGEAGGEAVAGGGPPAPRSFDRALRKLGLSHDALADPAVPREAGRPPRRRAPMRSEIAAEEPYAAPALAWDAPKGEPAEREKGEAAKKGGEGADSEGRPWRQSAQMSGTAAFAKLDPSRLHPARPPAAPRAN